MQTTYWEIYITYGENPCPVCLPLDMTIYQKGQGPQPPMHPNCQCARQDYQIEYIFGTPGLEDMAAIYGVPIEYLPPSVFIPFD